jgi:hypothetical protein
MKPRLERDTKLHSKIEQGDQEDSDGGVLKYVGVVPTQATKLYE